MAFSQRLSAQYYASVHHDIRARMAETGVDVLVVVEGAAALQEAKTLWRAVGEGRILQALRVHQRAPDPFTGTVPNLQPLGAVHVGTVVVDAGRIR